MSEPVFERVAVIGLGLLGGSVAAAAKRSGVATAVAGSSRSSDVREFALRRDWVDDAGSPIEVARGADLVVLATPVHAMADMLSELAPALRPSAIVTDVGSVKAQLAETLPGLMRLKLLVSGPKRTRCFQYVEPVHRSLFVTVGLDLAKNGITWRRRNARRTMTSPPSLIACT